MVTRTVEDRVSAAHMKIFRNKDWCTFSGLLLMGKWKVVDTDITACVNASGDKLYGRKFMSGLNDAEFMYLVLHETLHFAYSQLTMWKDYFKADRRLAGLVADHVVNNVINSVETDGKFAKMPQTNGVPNGVCDEKYRGWSFKEVWNDMKSQQQQQQSKGGSGGGDGLGDMLDEHSLEGSDGVELTEEEVNAVQKAVDTALRNGAFIAGKQGGNAKRVLGDLLDSKIPWEDQLRDFAMELRKGQGESTWNRPHRRFVSSDLYLPSSVEETIGELVVAIDTSGSIDDKMLAAFVSEVMGMCRASCPEKLHILYWDTHVAAHEEYVPDQYDQLPSMTKAAGGGGTDPTCIFHYIKEHKIEPIACIVLTDGCFDMPERVSEYPVLWVSTETDASHFTWGKTIRLELN